MIYEKEKIFRHILLIYIYVNAWIWLCWLYLWYLQPYFYLSHSPNNASFPAAPSSKIGSCSKMGGSSSQMAGSSSKSIIMSTSLDRFLSSFAFSLLLFASSRSRARDHLSWNLNRDQTNILGTIKNILWSKLWILHLTNFKYWWFAFSGRIDKPHSPLWAHTLSGTRLL